MYKEIALQVNNNCNLECPFCFSNKANTSISIAKAKIVKDFCITENIDTVKITGGEPFLHEKISELINLFLDFNIFIFSNCTIKNCFQKIETIFYKGIMPSEKVLDFPVDCNTLTGSVNL